MTELNLIGTTLGRFEILKELGRGGMAVVYQARQTDLERIVALKVLPPALTHDPSYVARFRQEARSAAQLEHPHIMPIYEVGEAAGLHYIAMKYIAGQTVKDLVHQAGSLPVQQAATILAQVGDALDYAHKQGVIHRDIKPSNMMVTEEGWVYLTDFGLARGTSGANAGLTMAGTVMGTPEYMSPEQAQGLPNVGPATDIYALGVVLYELLTGTFPFQADTPMGMLAARLLQAPTPPRDVRGDLPPAVEDVVMRALARKPEARFPSAATMVTALRAAAGIGNVEPPRPTTPVAGVPALGATILERPQPPGQIAPTPHNPPYVRPTSSPQATLPVGGRRPLPTAGVQPEVLPGLAPGAAPARKGPSNLAVILGALGVVVMGCVGLLAVFAIRGGDDPGPGTLRTAVTSGDVPVLLSQADTALAGDQGLAAAIGGYRKALELAPNDPLVLAKLALATNASGDWPTAEDYANQLIDATASSDGQVALGYALLADALASQGDVTAARDEISRAIEHDPDLSLGHAIESNLLASRAVAIGSSAEMDDALSSLDRAVDQLGDEEEILIQALTRNALGYTFSQEYRLSGDAESLRQSGEQYQAALDLLPSAGLFLANLAWLQFEQAHYDQARDGFAAARDAGYTPAQADIGWMYYYEDKLSEAEQAFDEAIALDADMPDGYYGKARLRYDEEDYDGAIELLSQAVARNPRSPDMQGWLGEAYFWKGFYSEDTADEESAFARAADAYAAALERNDRHIFSVSGLAWTLQHQQNYVESVAQFDQALKLDPDRAGDYNGKGWSLFNLDRFQEAEAAFRAALERDETLADAHFRLGRALEAQERTEEARAQYQRTLELDAENSAAQEALDRLGS